MKFLAVSKTSFTKILTGIMILTGLIFTGCNVNNNDGNKGKFRVSLTDAPGDYAAVNIEVKQILIKTSDDSDDDSESDMVDEEGSWKVIFDDSMVVNLLDYQNGTTLFLGETELETGIYEEMRLVLGDNNSIVLNNGSSVNLTVPSAQTSGYKIKLNTEVEPDQVTDLVIDFDAARSIVVRGNGDFNLKQVLRVVEVDDAGSISGTIGQSDADAWVYTVAGEDTVSTMPNESGEFTLYGLEAGTYDVTIDSQTEVYVDSTIYDIELDTNEHFEFENTILLDTLSR
tara:strand:- start:679 stop:1533 length:855 start_codon:yes stop_codon:yes gene_type:complete